MIEDEPCAQMLRECQVRYGQGYLFGKPAFDVSQFAAIPKRKPKLLPAAPKSSETATVITPDQMLKQRKARSAEPPAPVSRRPKVRQDNW
jgi:EAL domain-containing protein (putative c-di-GMP-specific phosphodiesterase class I)